MFIIRTDGSTTLNKDLYINKKTFKCLEGLVSNGIDWIKIPEEAEVGYYFDGSDPECAEDLVFYTKDLEATWSDEYWSDNVKSYSPTYQEIKNYVKEHGKLVWKRNVCDSPIKDEDNVEIDQTKKLIKSDGGSSDYYKRKIPELMLDRWNKDGFIEAKDVMKLFLGNDYNFCNSFKAHCRVQSLRYGVGKDGASEKYDLRKAWFFCEDAYNNYLEVNENVKRK